MVSSVTHISLNLLLFAREYNSALASSAASERVFSCAGLIFTAKRTNQKDVNFEAFVFLKLNCDCCRFGENNPCKTSKK
jgi:hypothetical protein